ncbi:chitinase [Leucosporidium creatinivorum]|uniref:Chitinase n=1 Tax=Leucosporidium creatinivorum TaxID=106004 RepID=A0A1Y2FPW7_9BASI|nr:chitinase [Leucosporidium creatinivorum]
MRIFSSSALLLLLSYIGAVSAAAPIIAQYWPAYSSQTSSQVPYNQLSIAYYFVTVTTSTGFELGGGQSVSEMQSFVAKSKAAGKKPVFSLGGWTGSRYFSALVNTSAKRTKLARDISAFMTKYGFVGVDIDWEYPNSAGIGCNNPTGWDAANYLAFLKVLRSTIGTSNLITAAVSVNGIIGINGSPLASFADFAKYFDYINLMTYDIAGPWSDKTGPTSPLRTCSSDTSVTQAVELWTSRGFPASKILLGIPSYGISFTTKSSTLATTNVAGYSSRIYQSWTGVTPKGAPGDSNAAGTDVCGNKGNGGYSGQWTYKQLISEGLLSSTGTRGLNGYVRYFDECTQVPFLWKSSTRHMIVYDDATSAAAKASFAKSKGLAGVMIFDTTGFDSRVYSAIKSRLGIA